VQKKANKVELLKTKESNKTQDLRLVTTIQQSDKSKLLGNASSQEKIKKDSTSRVLSSTFSVLNETGEQLQQRGEKLSQLSDRTADMANQASEFAKLAKQLNDQQKSRWF
jgi:ABC-type transporter Mla subunit MlaD